MRFTVIPADGVVSVDGRGFSNLDLSFMPAEIHALSWSDKEGEIQLKDEHGFITKNLRFDDYSPYQPALDAWEAARQAADAVAPPAVLTQREKDVRRYSLRAQVKDSIVIEMAADNMARVRAGEWTVGDLTDLMADPVIKKVLELLDTLSFELAAQALQTSTHPLLTPSVKTSMLARLQAHFYLD